MKNIIYSIFDKATQEHAAPFVAQNDDSAFRLVRGSFSSQSQLVLYPSDYSLVQLGSFDSSTGIVEAEYKVIEEIRALIPVQLRDAALDGTFSGGVGNEA